MDYPPPICSACRHLISTPRRVGERATCTAYPEGIPTGIWPEGGDHRKPWPGDNGVRFEQDPSAPPVDEVYSPPELPV